MAQAYTYLLGQCCDVAKVNVITPLCLMICMYYGDDDVTVDATKGGVLYLIINSVKEHYDENTFQDTWNRCYNGIPTGFYSYIQYAG